MTRPMSEEREAFIEKVIRDVCELPDRSSPEGQPEMMLVTGEELDAILQERLEEAALLSTSSAERGMREALEWTPMPKEKPGVFPFTGARLLVAWAATPSLSEHVELGRWRSGTGPGSGWCNTYGHSFGGTPTHYMALPHGPAALDKATKA